MFIKSRQREREQYTYALLLLLLLLLPSSPSLKINSEIDNLGLQLRERNGVVPHTTVNYYGLNSEIRLCRFIFSIELHYDHTHLHTEMNVCKNR